MKQSLKLIWEKELKKINKSMNSLVGINLTADAFAKALGIDRSTKAPV